MASKTAFEGVSRFSGFKGSPWDFVISGIDTDETFPDCPFVDEASNNTEVKEEFIRAMMFQRFIGGIVVAKSGGPHPIVVDGRLRLRTARIATERLEEQGKPPIIVKAVKFDYNANNRDLDVFGAVVGMNEHRREKTPLERAQQAAQLQRYGATVEETAAIMGVTAQSVRNWNDLNTLAPKVRQTVSSGKVTASTAKLVKDMPEKEQVEVIDELTSSGEKVTASKAAKVIRRRAEAKAEQNPVTEPPKKTASTSASKPPKPLAPKLPPIPRRGKKEVKAILDSSSKLVADFKNGALWAIGVLSDADVGILTKAPNEPVVSPKPGEFKPAKRNGPKR